MTMSKFYLRRQILLVLLFLTCEEALTASDGLGDHNITSRYPRRLQSDSQTGQMTGKGISHSRGINRTTASGSNKSLQRQSANRLDAKATGILQQPALRVNRTVQALGSGLNKPSQRQSANQVDTKAVGVSQQSVSKVNKTVQRYPPVHVTKTVHQLVPKVTQQTDSSDTDRKEEENLVPEACKNPIRFETSDPNSHNWIWEKNVLQDPNMTSWFNLVNLTSKDWLDFKRHINQSKFFNSMPRVYHVSPFVLERQKAPEMFALLQDFRNSTTMYNSSAPADHHDNNVLAKVYKLMYKDEGGYDILQKVRRIAVFRNVRANQYGLVQDHATCKVIRNGGCTYMSHGKLYQLPGSARHYSASQPVIQLGAGASGTYHFIMELLVGLAGVDEKTLSQSKIHIPNRSGFMIEWLRLVGVNPNQVIADSHIFAEKLLVPEMGYCGMPWYEQLEWLSNKALLSVAESIQPRDRPKIVLIKRSIHRTAPNFEEVHQTVRKYAEAMNYAFELHDDRRLPSLRDQIIRFATTDIMVSTHGAGQIFINFMPRHGCVLDFSLRDEPWPIYSRLAYLRKVSYLYYEHPDRKVNITILEEGLRTCSEVLKDVNITAASNVMAGLFLPSSSSSSNTSAAKI